MMKKLQTKIAAMIGTDFTTWMPFIVMAILYSYSAIKDDALDFIYPICSFILFPINSVINPMIYNGYIALRFFENLCK